MEIDMVPEGPKHIPPYVSRNQSSLGELLLGFLKYYATDFRYPKDITLLGLVFHMHPWFFCLLLFLLPFPVSHSCCQLLLALQSPVSLFLPLSCILFSGLMFLGKRQEQVGPLALHSTNMTYHDHCVCSMCVTVPCHSHKC